MIYKCKMCGGVLEYSAELNQMMCYSCGTPYNVADLSSLEAKEEQKILSPGSVNNNFFSGFTNFASDEVGDYNTILQRKKEEEEKQDNRKKASIPMNIMKCTSCGAELAVNGVETSTFCAYCGQATVVSDRVEDYLRPDWIIPFKVTKEDANAIVRNQLKSGFFVPEGIKNFEVEKIRGIYVPFWLFDLYYHDRQFYKYSKKQGKSSVTRYEYFEGETNFRKMTLDASKNLNDDSSARLEPFDMRQLKPFDAAYLSGFYSDRFDLGIDEMTGSAVEKGMELYNEQVRNELAHKNSTLVRSNPDYRVIDAQYALLPAWFFTFRYQGDPYTILVNGQTGKMVGAVPFNKTKVYLIFAVLAIVLSVLSVILNVALADFFFVNVGFDEKITWIYVIGAPALIILIWRSAITKYNRLVKSLQLTRSKKINKFAKERQDR